MPPAPSLARTSYGQLLTDQHRVLADSATAKIRRSSTLDASRRAEADPPAQIGARIGRTETGAGGQWHACWILPLTITEE